MFTNYILSISLNKQHLHPGDKTSVPVERIAIHLPVDLEEITRSSELMQGLADILQKRIVDLCNRDLSKVPEQPGVQQLHEHDLGQLINLMQKGEARYEIASSFQKDNKLFHLFQYALPKEGS